MVNSGTWKRWTVGFIYPKIRFLFCFKHELAEQLVIRAEQCKDQRDDTYPERVLILNVQQKDQDSSVFLFEHNEDGQDWEGSDSRDKKRVRRREDAVTFKQKRALQHREKENQEVDSRVLVCSWITAWLKIHWDHLIDRLWIYTHNIWRWRYKYRI